MNNVEILRVSPTAPEEAAIGQVAAVLAAGGLIVFPTDTLYGLAADPWRADAVARVFAAKGRSAAFALPLIAADRAQAERATTGFPPLAAKLADAFWPGPLTIVLPANPALAEGVHAGTGTVAVRVPNHLVARMVAKAAGGLVTATSANRSGREPSAEAAEACRGLEGLIDLLLDAGPTPGGPPSTIVDASETTLRLVRSGAVPFARVLQVATAP